MSVLVTYPDRHQELIPVRSEEEGHALIRQCQRLGYGATLLHVVARPR